MKKKCLKSVKIRMAILFILSSVCICLSYDNPYGTESGLPQNREQAAAEDKIWREMLAAGYSDIQIWD